MEFKSIDNREKKVKELKRLIHLLESWKEGEEFPEELSSRLGKITTEELKKESLALLNKSMNLALEKPMKKENKKLYLSEIIKKEKIELEGNNILILAPTGSGKTMFIHEMLKGKECKVLMLVSNVALKNSLAPEDNEVRREKENQSFTSRNRAYYGDEKYKIHVMSYAEFSLRTRANDNLINEVDYIFCDEFHSLPNYQSIKDSIDLAIAIRTLLRRFEGTKIFYLTATDEYLNHYENKYPGSFVNVKKYDFRNHPEIRKNSPSSEYKYSHIEEIRNHLVTRVKSFKYLESKCMAFSRTIKSQKRIAEIAEESGFVPLVLWSVNKTDDEQMTEEQIAARDYILRTGIIPPPYDFLVINSAMQEGWDLLDPNVNLIILNTTNETEYVQAMGRLRGDIQVAVSKGKENKKTEEKGLSLYIPSKYMNVPLSKEERDHLAELLNLKSPKGLTLKWQSIKKLLNDGNEYIVKEKHISKDGKRQRAVIIEKRQEDEICE